MPRAPIRSRSGSRLLDGVAEMPVPPPMRSAAPSARRPWFGGRGEGRLGRRLPKDTGLGVATTFGQERDMPTWVACVARVRVDRGSGVVTVEKLTIVVDAGTVVHPDGALAQVEGGALWGLSMALHEGTEFGKARSRTPTSTPIRPCAWATCRNSTSSSSTAPRSPSASASRRRRSWARPSPTRSSPPSGPPAPPANPTGGGAPRAHAYEASVVKRHAGYSARSRYATTLAPSLGHRRCKIRRKLLLRPRTEREETLQARILPAAEISTRIHHGCWPSYATADVATAPALTDAEIAERMSGNICPLFRLSQHCCRHP